MAQKPVPKDVKTIRKNVVLREYVNLSYENLKVEIQKELLRRKSKKYACVHVMVTKLTKKGTVNGHALLEFKNDKICNFGKERRFSMYKRIVSIEIYTYDPRYSEMKK